MNIFVTSIGEKSGKTIFAAGIAGVMQSLGYEMAICKPVQTGCKYANDKQFAPDLNFVKKVDPNIKTYGAFNYKYNTIPCIAADAERIKFSMEKVMRTYNNAIQENDIVIVEGTGGILTPLTSRLTVADMICSIKLPVVIVANVDNDFVNKTLMTLRTAEHYNIEVLGIVYNKYSPMDPKNPYHDSVKLLEEMTHCEVLGYLDDVDIKGEGINPENLISETLQTINLQKVFNMEIPKLNF